MALNMQLQMNPEFSAVIARSEGVQTFAFKKCEELKANAIRIFDSQVKHTHKPTLPEYRLSFFIKKITSGKNTSTYVVGNNDPAAVMVEFGAHAGGKTPVLNYAVLRGALDAAGG